MPESARAARHCVPPASASPYRSRPSVDAFEQQLIRLAPRLRRHARGLTGDGALADDPVQDTLERALRFRWRFHLRPGTWWGDGADGLFPWLLTIMHRLRLNTLRRKDLVAYTDTPPEVAAPETEPGLRLDRNRPWRSCPRRSGRSC